MVFNPNDYPEYNIRYNESFTETEATRISELLLASRITNFAHEYCSLSENDIETARGSQSETLYERVRRELLQWISDSPKTNDAAELKKRASEANYDMNFRMLIDESKPLKDQVNTLAKGTSEWDKWERFVTGYLVIKKRDAFAVKKSDGSDVFARNVILTFVNKQDCAFTKLSFLQAFDDSAWECFDSLDRVLETLQKIDYPDGPPHKATTTVSPTDTSTNTNPNLDTVDTRVVGKAGDTAAADDAAASGAKPKLPPQPNVPCAAAAAGVETEARVPTKRTWRKQTYPEDPLYELGSIITEFDYDEITAITAKEALQTIEQKWKMLKKQRENKLKPLKVAVLDSGVYGDHPCLRGHVFSVDSSNADHLEDMADHGTGVAGIIRKFAPMVDIVSVRCLCEGRVVTLVEAVERMIRPGATGWNTNVDIINLSCHRPADESMLDNLFLLSKSCVIVAAAGNEGQRETETVSFPAEEGRVFAVGSEDGYGNRSNFSAVGRNLFCLAFGDNVPSTSAYRMNPFKTFTGTSFASPFVCAIAALVLVWAEYFCGTKEFKNDGDLRSKLREHKRMESVLLQMCRKNTHTSEDGYGSIAPWKMLGSEDRMKLAIKDALKIMP